MDGRELGVRGLLPFRNVYDSVNAIFGGDFGAVVLNGFHAAKPAIPSSVFGRADSVWPAVQRVLDEQFAARPTLTHNDSHIDNWFPSPIDGRLRLGELWNRYRAQLFMVLAVVEPDRQVRCRFQVPRYGRDFRDHSTDHHGDRRPGGVRLTAAG